MHQLPEADTEGRKTVSRAVADRESRRSFADEPLDETDVAQALWSAQGVTHQRDGVEMRAAPSAGATYPLTVFLEVRRNGCETLGAGVYRYVPDAEPHAVEEHTASSVRDELVAAAGGQNVVRDAPVSVVMTADYAITTREYPHHGERYVHMEAGHAAQNVHLVCEERGMVSCPVGAFSDEAVASAMGIETEPLYIVPFGKPP